jgi:hypothetical protein
MFREGIRGGFVTTIGRNTVTTGTTGCRTRYAQYRSAGISSSGTSHNQARDRVGSGTVVIESGRALVVVVEIGGGVAELVLSSLAMPEGTSSRTSSA